MKRITAMVCALAAASCFFTVSAKAMEPDLAVPDRGYGMGTAAPSPAVTISAPSAVLMEASTGQVIYEKNGDAETQSCQCHQGHDPSFQF